MWPIIASRGWQSGLPQIGETVGHFGTMGQFSSLVRRTFGRHLQDLEWVT
jgi:hypothetical protein